MFIVQKYLQASDFLQNVVYINLASSEEDKVRMAVLRINLFWDFCLLE